MNGSTTLDPVEQRRLALNKAGLWAQVLVIAILIVFRTVEVYTDCLSDDNDRSWRDEGKNLSNSKIRGSSKGKWKVYQGCVEIREIYKRGKFEFRQREWSWGSCLLALLVGLALLNGRNDFIHVTRGFGMIGASQLPTVVILSIKSSCSPIQIILRQSHERINNLHQVLGCIVIVLFSLHSICYVWFYVQKGLLREKIYSWTVWKGLFGLGVSWTLWLTSRKAIRRNKYGMFRLMHAITVPSLIFMLYIHVNYARRYVWQAVSLIMVDYVGRWLKTNYYKASLYEIPGTQLICVEISGKANGEYGDDDKLFNKKSVGQHVYINDDGSSGDFIKLVKRITRGEWGNPFTIVQINEKKGKKRAKLIVRIRKGNTMKFKKICEQNKGEIMLMSVEGPYGQRILEKLERLNYEKIVIICGGVGGTYGVAAWKQIYQRFLTDQGGLPQVRFIWSVKRLEEVNWAIHDDEIYGKEREKFVEYMEKSIEIYLTERNENDTEWMSTDMVNKSMEWKQLWNRIHTGRMDVGAKIAELKGRQVEQRRWKSESKSGMAILIIVCGPESMVNRVRDETKVLIKQGYKIDWHEEVFGW